MRNNCVSYYTIGTATIAVSFPEDKVFCNWCHFIRSEDSLKRHRCLLTDEYLPYPFTGRGNRCPVVLDPEKLEVEDVKDDQV